MKKKYFWSLYKGFGKLFDWIGTIVAGMMFLLLAYQIIIRILYRGSSPAANELVTYLFIWMIYIGMVIAAKDDSHICVTMLADAFPHRIKYLVYLVAHCLWLYFSGYIVYISILMTKRMNELGSATTVLHIPFWILNTILPVCFACGSVYIVRNIIRFAKEVFGKK